MLQRHVLKAPFNAWVLEKMSRLDNGGPRVSAATLVGSDSIGHKCLPVDQIQHQLQQTINPSYGSCAPKWGIPKDWPQKAM